MKKWEESLQKVKRVNRPQLSASQSPSHAAAAVKEQAAPASGAGINLKRRIVVAKYNYKGSGHGDITFNKGDKMEIVNELSGWYVVRNNESGETGQIPKNFEMFLLSVEFLNSKPSIDQIQKLIESGKKKLEAKPKINI